MNSKMEDTGFHSQSCDANDAAATKSAATRSSLEEGYRPTTQEAARDYGLSDKVSERINHLVTDMAVELFERAKEGQEEVIDRLTIGGFRGQLEKKISHGSITLSGRESEILRCLVDGDSNKAIANRLGITESTVKVHMKSLLRKLKVSNRTQAALWANEHMDLQQAKDDLD